MSKAEKISKNYINQFLQETIPTDSLDVLLPALHAYTEKQRYWSQIEININQYLKSLGIISKTDPLERKNKSPITIFYLQQDIQDSDGEKETPKDSLQLDIQDKQTHLRDIPISQSKFSQQQNLQDVNKKYPQQIQSQNNSWNNQQLTKMEPTKPKESDFKLGKNPLLKRRSNQQTQQRDSIKLQSSIVDY